MNEGRRVSGGAARPLVELALGTVASVVAIDKAFRAELALEGVHIGSLVVIRGRAPLRGPVLLGVGRGRVAVGHSVAATVSVVAESLSDDPVSDAAG